MTALELARVAASIVPPVGATMAIARVDERLKHRAAFLIDGRIHGDPVGPAFDRPRDAIRLVALLNGETPRSAAQPDAVATPIEAPSLGEVASPRCAGCGGPLPPGRHGQRRLTCSTACRRRAARRAAAEAVRADTDGGVAPVTPSRPSQAVTPDPTASAAPSAHRLLGPARDARPEPGSAGPLGDVPTLGL